GHDENRQAPGRTQPGAKIARKTHGLIVPHAVAADSQQNLIFSSFRIRAGTPQLNSAYTECSRSGANGALRCGGIMRLVALVIQFGVRRLRSPWVGAGALIFLATTLESCSSSTNASYDEAGDSRTTTDAGTSDMTDASSRSALADAASATVTDAGAVADAA